MNNLPHDDHQNLVNFLRQNCPTTPAPNCNLEQRLMDSIAHQPQYKPKQSSRLVWTIPSAIATGFLVTSVSLGFKTSQVAIETEELENFIVNNWHETIARDSYTFPSEAETYWLLPTASETQATLSISTD